MYSNENLKCINSLTRQKESLQMDLAIQIQNAIAKWQAETGLNIDSVHINTEQGKFNKLVVVDVDVKLGLSI